MDLRMWLLVNDPPASSELDGLIDHIPCSDFRTANILRLFAVASRTGFKLTDADGQPTEALRTMVGLMDDAELCTGQQLPVEERKAFGKDDGSLINVLSNAWYLRGITDRVKAACSVMGRWQKAWLYEFLRGWDGTRVTYRDPDGKSRKRVCYIAHCPPNWEVTDSVYEGLWRWNREHVDSVGAYNFARPPRPDGYGILERREDIGRIYSDGIPEPSVQAPGAAPGASVPEAVVCAWYGKADGADGAAGGGRPDCPSGGVDRSVSAASGSLGSSTNL